MEAFKLVYLEKCRDFVTTPIEPLMLAVSVAIDAGVVISNFVLNGNSKELFNNRLQYMQVFALMEALQEYPYVTHLDLSYNHLDDAALATVVRLLKYRNTLVHVNLEGYNFTADGATKLAEELSQQGSVLEVLNLAFNPLGEAGGQALAAMLEKNTTLRVLELGNTDLGIKSLVRLASALAAHNRTLQFLSVESPLLNTVMEEGTLHFARALAANHTLRALRFGKHALRDAGAETLVAYGLVTNTTLTSLDLRCNSMSEVAGSSLARLLMENGTITSLVLSSNRLRDAGAAAVAAALPHNCSLTHLDLSSNSVEEKGLLALADGVRANSTLRSLRLWGNAFAPMASAAWLQLVRDRQTHAMPLDLDIAPYQVDHHVYVAKEDARVALLTPSAAFALAA